VSYEEQATDPGQFSKSNLLRVSVNWASTVATMTLAGEVDMSSVHLLTDPLKEALEKGEMSGLVIDLGLVTFLDSSGLSFLITAHKQLASRGGRLEIVGATPQVQRLFDITGLRSILTISPE
jgi:anti-sigma B factor antagonist